MEIDLGPEAEAFRDELRDWLAANRPDGLDPDAGERGADPGLGGARLRTWTDTLHEAGYLCVSWPQEYGGRGLSGLEVAVMNEEFAGAGVPRVTRGMGEWLVGPSIIVHGTDEQKAYFLPRIISGTDRYCQGFSEPDAGSDLASLTTRGVVDGDEIIITGQKVWTSGAQLANMMFCLCRTDPAAPRHQGISYVLVPMKTPQGESNGIELRPLRQITGASGFTESFLTEARAPLFNVIGGLNNGWRVTMTTLGNERGGNATTQHVRYQRQFWRLVDEARTLGRADDPIVRQDLARAYTQVEIMRYAGLRTLSEVVARREPGPGASINKMFWSEYARDIGEWAMNLRGARSMIRPDGDGYPVDRWQADFLGSRSGTIWGGTAQVQRNIVGERVLGLPKEPGHERSGNPVRATRVANATSAPAPAVPASDGCRSATGSTIAEREAHMPHTFLSDDWFDAVEELREEMPDPPPALKDLTLNIVVAGGPDGDREIHMTGGQFERGLAEGAPTKVTVPFDVAKAMFIDGNQQAGMQAFMSGQIKVEGDMTKLMAMQAGGGAPTPEQQQLQAKLQALTA